MCSHSTHQRRKHEPAIPYPTGCIGALFPHNKEMYRHVRLTYPTYTADPDNGIPPEGGTCPYPDCSIQFTRKDNLTRHIQEIHADQKKRSHTASSRSSAGE